MVKKRFLFAQVILIVTGIALSQDESTNFRFFEKLPLDEITDEPLPLMRNGTISPDASMIAWATPTNLCIYTIETTSEDCTPYPDAPQLTVAHMVWSPDSTVLAIEEPSFERFQDGDLWLFDVADHAFHNRTDDGSEAPLLGHPESGEPVPMLDMVPTWDQTNGDLYFMRINFFEDPRTIDLVKIPAAQLMDDSEPEQVMELTSLAENMWGSVYNDARRYSLNGAVAISPDASKIAVLARGPRRDDPGNGVWVLSLETGNVETFVQRSELQQHRLPEWVDTELYYEDGLAWSNSGLIVTMVDISGDVQISWISTYIDTDSGEVTPLLDYANIEDQQAYFLRENTDGAVATQYGIVSPDGMHFIYTSSNPQLPDASVVWSISLPPDGAEPIQHSPRLDIDDLSGNFTSRVSYGVDGDTLRILMGNFLYTFEIEASDAS